jgi:ABC-2 type transport system permease protein
MKIIDIALKDLTRSFRSVFAVLFMFVIPLVVTGMFYVMFGGMKSGNTGFSLPQTKVVIANLDEGGTGFETAMTQFPADANIQSMGDMVVYVLQDASFSDLMQVTRVDSAEAARSAVDSQEAGVAIVIPADFSAQFSNLEGQAALELYQDPTLTLGPAIVKTILNQFMDGLSGTKIAVNIATAQSGSSDPAFIGQVVQAYLSSSSAWRDPAALLEVHSPAAANTEETPLMVRIIGPILGGMMVFYAFYTGTATAQTILREDEDGTLPRLFTTPTPQAIILGGKLLAVLLTVTIQVIVLLTLGTLIFRINWGTLGSVALFSVGTILSASAFGVFVNSLLKSSKQGGFVFGGVLTFSGMIGMMPIFAFASPSTTLDTISLIVPQGWAVRGLFQSMQGAASSDVLVSLLVMFAWAAVFFSVGVWRLQKRYA